MENTRLVEILEMVKENLIETEAQYQTGICRSIEKLSHDHKIKYLEEILIKKHLYLHKPTKTNEYAKFTENQYWYDYYNDYWWSEIKCANETKQIRIDYLTAVIDNIK